MLRRCGLSGLVIVALAACGSSGGDNGGADGGNSDATSSGSSGGGSGSGGSSGSGSSSGGGSGSSSGGGSGSSSGGGSGSSSGSSSGGDAGSNGGAGVLQFHMHLNRDGFYVDPALTKTAAAGVHRDTTFTGTITGNVYASPLYVQNKAGGKGTFYVATESDTVYALDETTGIADWHVSVGTAATQTGAGCGNIGPIGITGTPAIDLATNLIVLDGAVADSSGNIGTHTIFGLSLADGSTKWSVDVSKLTASGTTFNPPPQNQRAAVLIVNGTAYVAYGGHYGDCGNYHGWVVGVPLANPTAAKAWATQVAGAGIWGAGGPSSDGQSIFVTTGNGIGGSNTTWQESEGVFRLDPGPSFTQTNPDYFAPSNWAALDSADKDISGSGPLVIDAPSMTPSALVLGQGKDGNLYLLDRSNLGGVTNAPLGMLHVSGGEISNAGAAATIGNTTYVVIRPNGTQAGVGCPSGTSGDLVAVKLDPTATQKMSVVWCANGMGQGSPIITTSDGTNDALVWTAGAQSSNALHAWDLASGTLVFTGGATADKIANVRRFTSPIVVNGRIIVAGDNAVYALKP